MQPFMLMYLQEQETHFKKAKDIGSSQGLMSKISISSLTVKPVKLVKPVKWKTSKTSKKGKYRITGKPGDQQNQKKRSNQ